jgi:hypothetical protein
MMFRPDTSFPYLALARRAGVDYGQLLRRADEIRLMQITEINALCDRIPLVASLVYVMDAEKRRRATIAHHAMHTGDAP